MNWAKLITSILKDTGTRDDKAITASYFIKYLEEKSTFNEYFDQSIKEFETYQEFRERFHKGLRQMDPLGDPFLEMTLHGFLNQNIYSLEEAFKFGYWLNKKYPEEKDIKRSIDHFFFDFDLDFKNVEGL